MREGLSHAEQDKRDFAYMAELMELPKFPGGFSKLSLNEQVRISGLMRANLIKYFPQYKAMFAALPELN